MFQFYIIQNKRTKLTKSIKLTDYTDKELNKIVNFYLSHKDYTIKIEQSQTN